jgi:hypothetical protein
MDQADVIVRPHAISSAPGFSGNGQVEEVA